MINKYFLLFLSLFLITGLYSQKNINNYKYVIVPKRFDFLKRVDQYQFNSLTKFLLEKENFVTYFDDESLPGDLAMDKCLALYTDVIDDSGLFTTKLSVILKNCTNDMIFSSRVGDSKEKEYKKAYYEAIREAFESFKGINYNYEPNEMENKKVANIPEKVVVAEIPQPNKPKTPVLDEVDESELLEREVENIDTSKNNLLYAQAIDNGFQLVNNTPKVVLTIYYSGKKDVFIVKGKDAVIYKLNDLWVISEQIGSNLETKNINIKF